MSSTDTLTRQMHESRARRLVDAETRAAAAEAIRKDLEERLADAESLDEIRVVLGAELEVVRAIHREALGSSAADDDPIDAALAALLHPPAEPAEDSWS